MAVENVTVGVAELVRQRLLTRAPPRRRARIVLLELVQGMKTTGTVWL
ncbi:hypothetical protein [Streptomyces sp. AM6-12]